MKKFEYTRKDVLSMLKTPPLQGQKMHDSKDAQQMMKYALEDMDIYGYDFGYSTKIDYFGKYKTMKKQVYLQFKCWKCKKTFTSIVGTLQIRFSIKKLQNSKMKHPYLIVFKLKMYRMKCMECNNYVNPKIYDSQLKACQINFCLIIDQILRNIPPPPKKKKPKRYLKQIHNHKEAYCQACFLNKCITLT